MPNMDLTTYDGLQAAIADFLNRDDLSTQIPGFIALCEARIARNVRRKTIRNDAFAVATEVVALPSDCQELRSLLPLTGTPTRDKAIKIVTPAMLADERMQTAGLQGTPIMAAIVDGNLIFAPPPDQTYTHRIIYFQKNVPLSGSDESNAILLEAPDIYLYGSLLAAAPFLEHDERIPVWTDLFNTAVSELNDAREREETAANIHGVRLPVWF